jgi:hypothetical protein
LGEPEPKGPRVPAVGVDPPDGQATRPGLGMFPDRL